MKHSRQMTKACVALVALTGILLSSPGSPSAQSHATEAAPADPGQAQAAEEPRYYREPGATTMIIDGLVVRPVAFVATVIGSVFYVVTLPFSALAGNADEAGEKMVVAPAEYTFTRCLGCFRELP